MNGRSPGAGVAALVAVVALTLVACSSDGDSTAANAGGGTPTTTTSVVPSPVIVAEGPGAGVVIGDAGRFGTFLELVAAAGLGDTVDLGGPWTLFAPDDAALDALDPSVLEDLRNDPEAARTFVLAHVVAGVWRSAELQTLGGQTLTSEAQTTLTFTVSDGVVTIAGEPEGAVTVEPLGLEAANAIIHAVNRPLLPPS